MLENASAGGYGAPSRGIGPFRCLQSVLIPFLFCMLEAAIGYDDATIYLRQRPLPFGIHRTKTIYLQYAKGKTTHPL